MDKLSSRCILCSRRPAGEESFSCILRSMGPSEWSSPAMFASCTSSTPPHLHVTTFSSRSCTNDIGVPSLVSQSYPPVRLIAQIVQSRTYPPTHTPCRGTRLTGDLDPVHVTRGTCSGWKLGLGVSAAGPCIKRPSYQRGLGPDGGGVCGGRRAVVWVRLVCGVSGECPGTEEKTARVRRAWDHGSLGERKEPSGYTLGYYTGDDGDGDRPIHSCGSF